MSPSHFPQVVILNIPFWFPLFPTVPRYEVVEGALDVESKDLVECWFCFLKSLSFPELCGDGDNSTYFTVLVQILVSNVNDSAFETMKVLRRLSGLARYIRVDFHFAQHSFYFIKV